MRPGLLHGRGRRPSRLGALRRAPQGDGYNSCRWIQKLAAALVALITLTAAAAAQPALQCTGAQNPWTVAELLFGRGNVSDINWNRFLDAEITPRFPDGLTIYDA